MYLLKNIKHRCIYEVWALYGYPQSAAPFLNNSV